MTEAEFNARISELFASIDRRLEQAEWRARLQRHPSAGPASSQLEQPVRQLFPEVG